MHKTGTKEDEAGKKLRSYKVRNRAEGQSIGPMTFGPTCLIVCPTTLMDNVSESLHCLRQLLILLYDNITVGTRIRNGELRMVNHRITLPDRFRSQWGYFECGRLDNRADEKRVLNRYKQGFFDIGKWGSCPPKSSRSDNQLIVALQSSPRMQLYVLPKGQSKICTSRENHQNDVPGSPPSNFPFFPTASSSSTKRTPSKIPNLISASQPRV